MMTKLLVAVVVLVFAVSCAPATGVATQQILMQEDFDPLYGWKLAKDDVGCPAFPVDPVTDINLQFADGSMILEANPLEKGGLFGNAIAYRGFEFQGKGHYMLAGAFRVPPGSQAEIVNAAIEVVRNGVGRYGEIIYGLNEYVLETYGKIYTRSLDFQPVVLFDIGVDNEWHVFTLGVYIDTEKNIYQIVSIGVDGELKKVDIPMTSVEKPWDSSSQILIETHNMFTNCDSKIVTHGISMWDNITILHLP